MAWLQLSLDLEALNPDTVQACCEDLGALSVTLSDAGDQPVVEPLPGTTPMWPDIRLMALFEVEEACAASAGQLRGALAATLGVLPQRITVDELAERDWASEWRKDAQPTRFGQHLWVCQDGQRPDDAEALIVDLDPGLAFGTGSHPSTALCLEWLACTPVTGKSVVDYGCGSGILAVAAARLGARTVLATDIDDQALLATRDNAASNNLRDKIVVLKPDDLPQHETDILVANILSNPLRQLAPRFAGLVRPGGQIALAGILQEQVDVVLRDYGFAFDMAQSGRRGDWAILAGRRRPSIEIPD